MRLEVGGVLGEVCTGLLQKQGNTLNFKTDALQGKQRAALCKFALLFSFPPCSIA